MLGNFYRQLRSGDALLQFILINTVLFVSIQIYLLSSYVTGTPTNPKLGEDLMLAANSSLQVMADRPWTLVTHMFAHIHTGHFLFNMIALYSMGKIFLSIESAGRFRLIYFIGGISGYLLFVMSYHFSDVLSRGREHAILGASAAVIAIVVSTATLQPKRIVYLFGAVRLELAWLAGILIILDLASIRNGINSGGHIGHLGGALFGFIYGIVRRNSATGTSFGTRLKNLFTGGFQPGRMRIIHRRPKTDDQFNSERVDKQKKIDAILDKIGQSGYESLTQAEKDFLFKHSQK